MNRRIALRMLGTTGAAALAAPARAQQATDGAAT